MTRIHEIIAAECLPGVEITPDSALVADLHLDDLHRVCIACELDEAFGILIPDNALEAWETVADVIASVRALAGEGV